MHCHQDIPVGECARLIAVSHEQTFDRLYRVAFGHLRLLPTYFFFEEIDRQTVTVILETNDSISRRHRIEQGA